MSGMPEKEYSVWSAGAIGGSKSFNRQAEIQKLADKFNALETALRACVVVMERHSQGCEDLAGEWEGALAIARDTLRQVGLTVGKVKQ